SKETEGVLKGEYGSTPAPVNTELQQRVLNGAAPITCRPADLLEPELDKLTETLKALAAEKSIALAQGEELVDDVLTYALFPQIGLKFLVNRNNPAAFEPVPGSADASPVPPTPQGEEIYTVAVEGKFYTVAVSEGGDITGLVPMNGSAAPQALGDVLGSGGEAVVAPLGGIICKVLVK